MLIEEMELFGSCPGLHATLPHTFHAQPRGLTTLDVPVLLLWGKLDVILLPRQGRRFERLIPGRRAALHQRRRARPDGGRARAAR